MIVHERRHVALQVKQALILVGGSVNLNREWAFRSWQQPRRKAHVMKKFMLLAVFSVAISLRAGAMEPNSVSRYSSRAALLAPRVISQTQPTATVATGSLSSRLSFLAPRPGLVVVNAQALNTARYNTKAEFRGATESRR